MSLVRQNFCKDCEEAINNQINLELFASYVYLSMAYYFDRSDVALPGHYTYFKKASDEEREHAMKFMTYQNKRGGSIILKPIESPPKDDWESAHDAMMEALKLERQVNEAAYFGRADVALPGCESFFIQMHHEEHEHAIRFLNYIKMRGGLVNLYPVQPPIDQDWKCPLHAFKTALDLEMEVTEKLVAVNTVAEKHGDLNASDFIITGFMEDQMKSVNEIGRFVAVLSGIGDQSLARFIFDKDLLERYVQPKFNILRSKLRPNETDK